MVKKVFIIAEAGVNHNGSLALAKKLVDAAVNVGADAVKFQTFKAEALVLKSAPKAAYQKMATDKKESQFTMIKKLELSLDAHKALIDHCRRKKIIFLSSPFDIESVDLLNRLGLKIFKIPSGEITNLPYLRKIGALGKKIILSTGMSTLNEVKAAVGILVKSGTKRESITVLHCNTQYPTPFGDVNLSAMPAMKEKLGVSVGYSDHTLGVEAAIAAVALGAVVIEKHFTLNRNLPGPDHKASLEPKEFKAMAEAIRNIEAALGDGIKKPSPSEFSNIKIVRKGLVAAKPIYRGEKFTPENITAKRPATGLSPMLWGKVVGRRARKNYITDEIIKL